MRKTAVLLWITVLLTFLLCGCRFIKIEEEEPRPLEYTIVKQEEIPEEALSLIEAKKSGEFQMTYQVGDDLYLIKGYGRQMTGGYSIQAAEVSLSSNAVFFKTKLLGPSDDTLTTQPSYPYIVIKIKYLEEPVEFV